MNLRTASLSILVLLPLTLASCGTTRRAGKDVGVAVLSPVIALYGGSVDGFGAAEGVREGWDGGPFIGVLVAPFTFTFHTVKHAVYCGIHAVDFFLFPFYGMAELYPQGPNVVPLEYYTGTPFDRPDDGEVRQSSTDPSSGESLPPAFNVDR